MVAEVEKQLIEIFAEVYPHWRLEDGACLNCIELFRAYRETFTRARPLWQPQPASEELLEKTVPCSLCGYEVPSEDFLFHRRIEEVLQERIKSDPPGGLKGDQEWPHCMGELASIVAASVIENSPSSKGSS